MQYLEKHSSGVYFKKLNLAHVKLIIEIV
jgi:hypothetical protein